MYINISADLSAHVGGWANQGFWAMVQYRFGHWSYAIASPWLCKPFSLLYKFFYKCIQIITGIELPCEMVVGLKNTADPCAPPIGYNVDIGANAVVTCNVPDDHLSVGVHAVFKLKRGLHKML